MKSMCVAPFQIFTVILLSSFLPEVEGAIQCYVCHYSPKNNLSEEYCTSDNFRADANQVVECELGCERVTYKDNNNKLEQFHRNCYRGNVTVPSECRDENQKNYKRNICVCHTNLCNNAISGSAWCLGTLTAILISALWLG